MNEYERTLHEQRLAVLKFELRNAADDARRAIGAIESHARLGNVISMADAETRLADLAVIARRLYDEKLLGAPDRERPTHKPATMKFIGGRTRYLTS